MFASERWAMELMFSPCALKIPPEDREELEGVVNVLCKCLRNSTTPSAVLPDFGGGNNAGANGSGRFAQSKDMAADPVRLGAVER